MPSYGTKDKILTDLSLLLTAMAWGGGYIAVKVSTDGGFSAELILVMRFVIAAVAVYIIFRKKLRNFTKNELVYGLVTGLFLFMAFYAQTYGIRYTSTSNNAFLTSVGVIIVPFLEWLIFRKRPAAKVFVSTVLAIIGIGILTGVSGTFLLNKGDMLTLLGSLLFSCHILSLGISTKKVETEKLLFMQVTVSAVLPLIFFLFFNLDSITLVTDWAPGIAAAAYLGIFSTAIAFFVQTAAQKNASPTSVTIILSTEALFAAIFSTILGYDELTKNLIIGGLIIISAVILLDIKLPRIRPRKGRKHKRQWCKTPNEVRKRLNERSSLL